jgi:cardiolipin synthase
MLYWAAYFVATKQKQEEAWCDTHVQTKGPVVAEFQELFLDTWVREKGQYWL